MRNLNIIILIVGLLVLSSCAPQQPVQQGQPQVITIDSNSQQQAQPAAPREPQEQGSYTSLESDTDVFTAVDASANELE